MFLFESLFAAECLRAPGAIDVLGAAVLHDALQLMSTAMRTHVRYVLIVKRAILLLVSVKLLGDAKNSV